MKITRFWTQGAMVFLLVSLVLSFQSCKKKAKEEGPSERTVLLTKAPWQGIEYREYEGDSLTYWEDWSDLRLKFDTDDTYKVYFLQDSTGGNWEWTEHETAIHFMPWEENEEFTLQVDTLTETKLSMHIEEVDDGIRERAELYFRR